MNKFGSSILAAVALLSLPCLVHGQSTETETDQVPTSSIISSDQSTPWTFNFAAFNTSLGTLESETVTFSGTLSLNQSIRSAGAYAEIVSLPFRLSGAGAPIDNQSIPLSASGTASGAGAIITPSSSFAFGPFTTSATSFSMYTTGLSVTQTTNHFSENSGSITGGTLAVTFTYEAIPEPSEWALMLAGGCVFILMGRVGRKFSF